MIILATNLPTVINHILSADQAFAWSKFVVMFLLIFIETAGIVTGFIPGDTILTSVGSVAGLHHNLWELLADCLVFGLASLCGDAVNYWFGGFLTRQIGRIPFLKKYLSGGVIDRLAVDFHPKRWLLFIVLGRFLPFIRVAVPLLAQRLGLPFAGYIKMAAFASFLWAFTITSLGYFIGHLAIPHEWLTIGLVVIAVALIVGLRSPKLRRAVLNLLVRK
ncbi:DedA family protein [Leuconostoc lactis]|uniref:DedA family protein n=1 Tax=Leuconostoc lactis TaxID=1246 RepID=UPI000498590A|nr:VTT domain-containing protein [Leuconostoc lactis]